MSQDKAYVKIWEIDERQRKHRMNNVDLYTEKLTWFRQNEKPEAVLVVADNPDLIKIVVAWTSLDVRRKT